MKASSHRRRADCDGDGFTGINRQPKQDILTPRCLALKTLEFYTECAQTALAEPQVRTKLDEVLSVLREVKVPVFKGKSSKQERLDLVHPVLNVYIEKWLKLLGWECQTALADIVDTEDPDKGSLDFSHRMADGRCIALEVQFGNGGRLERDYAKFEKIRAGQGLALAVIVYFDRATSATADSGLAVFETAVARKSMHGTLPLCILGVSRKDSEEVDLAVLKDIIFPSVLGGSGKGKDALIDYLGDALLLEKDLSELALPPAALEVVRKHAEAHVEKQLHALQVDVARVAAASNNKLRNSLLEMLTAAVKNSLNSPAWSKLVKDGSKAAAKQEREKLLTTGQVLPADSGTAVVAKAVKPADTSAEPHPEVDRSARVLRDNPLLPECQNPRPAQGAKRISAAQAKRNCDPAPRASRPVLDMHRVQRAPVQHFAMANAFMRAAQGAYS